jgi:UDP-N-acetylmuramoylalanine--D-glutamate ligase
MGSYEPLNGPIKEKVKSLILIGEAREKIKAALGGLTGTFLAPDLGEAVKTAFARACPGEIVLLSPACASFDQFESYAHRGRVFQEAVHGLG